jgi:EAL domain-containing protein (putative c-di-GMP-specific phosphodiesterase class I)
VYPIDGLDIDTLIMRADAAMYEAKERGRGQYRFASSVAGDDSRRRIEVEGELRRAIEQGRLRLHYQPQVAAGAAIPGSCAGIVGAEALIRMSRADGSIVSPGEFMDVAEDSGLVMPLGEWALGEACREAYRWSAAGKPLVVSVNVSTRQFERDKLVASVRAALDSSGLPPGLLKLEVTESLFMRNLEHSVEVMREIRSMGVSFAVDDFGIGFSSLQYLTRLPLDCLKIDKAFVDDVKDDFDGGEIVTAVIALARSFGLTCVAEGVETEAQLEALRRRGCDEFQGYLISRPLDADAFMRFIGAGVEA